MGNWRGERGSRAFLAALAATGAVAAIVALLGSEPSLVDLLAVPPLVTAVAIGWRRTAVLAATATALAVLLGLPDELSRESHLTAVATVAFGSALAVWLAALRQRRDNDAAEVGVQLAVARTLSDAESLEAAAPRLLEEVAGPLGWEVAALWDIRPPNVLRCLASWSAAGVEATEFHRVTREFVFRPGFGLPGRAWQANDAVWLPDVQADENFPRAPAARGAGLRTGIAFPIRAGGETLGVIELFTRRVRRREGQLVRFFEALGTQVGEFAEGLRSGEALRASEARKGAILESALDCVITIDHEGRIVEFNPAAEVTFGYRAEEAIGEEMGRLIVPPWLLERHRAALRRLVQTGRSSLLGRRLELTGMRKDGSEFPVELAISRLGGESPAMFTGYVRDITERKRAQTERERLLQLEQVGRLGAMQAREHLETILSGVADGVTAQAPDGRLVFANDAAAGTLGYSTVDELLAAPLDDVMARFEVFDEEGHRFPLESLPGRRAIAGEGPSEAVVRFRRRDTGEERWSIVKASPVLDEDGDVVMAINVFEDITEHKRSEQRQQFLAESSRILASSLDPDETLQRVARLAVPEIADWCVVDLRAPGGAIQRAALAQVDPAQVERAERLRDRYPPDPGAPTGVANVMRTGRPELNPEIPEELLERGAVDEEHLQLLREFGLRSTMVVPMVGRDRVIGALTFASGPSGRRFDEQDLSLAEEIARRCATAIENARLFTEYAYIARTLQQSLLPAELPSIPGLETAACYRAMGEGTEVGGDFYDMFQTRARGWTVVVGDVCGKGPDAAAVTALARYTLRAAAMRERLPSRILALLNEALLRQRDDGRFCTVAYAYVEAQDGGARIGFASGGHPLPLLLRADGSVERLGTHGTLLGVMPDPDLEDQTATLTAGDALVFYTDGVTEARGADAPLGDERLAAILASCAGQDAEAIAARVEQAALALQDGSPRDDIAVVVLRVPP
jgi:PAS domain S-box-containing protein